MSIQTDTSCKPFHERMTDNTRMWTVDKAALRKQAGGTLLPEETWVCSVDGQCEHREERSNEHRQWRGNWWIWKSNIYNQNGILFNVRLILKLC